MHICLTCGFGTTDWTRFEEHMIAVHTDKVVDELVTRAFREA